MLFNDFAVIAKILKRCGVRQNNGSVGALLKKIRKLDGKIVFEQHTPAKAAVYGSFGELDERVVSAVKALGIKKLYSHQSGAVEYALHGDDFVVVTPTSSGKTLCYNLPVCDAAVRGCSSRALYLFPTKALAQDQLKELDRLSQLLGGAVKSFTYDGDTPPAKRRLVRDEGNVIITNPDMLSSGILPRHTAWEKFFRNLKYIVVDEIHSYRGVFGSHLANLFARLERICEFYGSHPVFICCSATIANPKQHAEALTGRKMKLIARSGAPSSEKNFLIYNPKLLDKKRGIRRSSLFESARIASEAICSGISTIIFTRSRQNVELLLKTVRRKLQDNGKSPELAAGYRSGYLPKERRAIETGLRDGRIRGVISTNALELGIDIGSLEFAVLHGYPGSVASLRQQIGRAGRRNSFSAAVMVASSNATDRFIAANPQMLVNAPSERARINPSNPYVFVSHALCSVFELPFHKGDKFAGQNIDRILDYYAKRNVLRAAETSSGVIYTWNSGAYPAAEISLRSASGKYYSILDVTEQSRVRLIGTIDKASAPLLVFPGAVYFHAGQSYLVRELDAEKHECRVVLTSCDYFTESESVLRITVKDEIERRNMCGWGNASLCVVPRLFRKLKLMTHEEVGHGEITLSEETLDTSVCWFELPQKLEEKPWLGTALSGLAQLLKNIVPIFLMCDTNDVHVTWNTHDTYLKSPAIFIADNIPGGAGIAEGAFEIAGKLLEAAYGSISRCECDKGCPACVGISAENGENRKEIACNLLNIMLGENNKSTGAGNAAEEKFQQGFRK